MKNVKKMLPKVPFRIGIDTKGGKTKLNDRRSVSLSGKQAMTVWWRERAKDQKSSFRQAGNRFRENGKQVHRSLRIVSRKGGSRMASKPELLHNQAADEIGQDFLLAYQRAVLLALQRQGFLNEMQCRNCVQKLEEQKRNTGKSKSVKE